MSPSPLPGGTVRSAAELNAAIRALWPHRDARLSAEDRVEYEQLVVEWAAAVRGEVVKAA